MKKIITTVLLLFVAVSVVFLFVKDAGEVASFEPNSEEVVAYYFHGNARCKTCNKIETWTKEVVDQNSDFQWRVVNVDNPANEHFVQDFQISSSSVVLSDGNKFSELKLVWQLIRDEKDSFQMYVQNEIDEFINE